MPLQSDKKASRPEEGATHIASKIRCLLSTEFFCCQCNFVTEKHFPERYDKIITRKEATERKSELNPDRQVVSTIREGLKRASGYCPCRIEHTEATKCMCQELRIRAQIQTMRAFAIYFALGFFNILFAWGLE